MNNKERHEYKSSCCLAEMKESPMVVRTGPEAGTTHYYYKSCQKCGQPCHSVLTRLWDSAGVEVKPGDILENPDKPDWMCDRYHAVYTEADGSLEVRDLGGSNVGMYNIEGPYFNIGHYTKHLDKVSQENIDYFWPKEEG